jgi:hypothetical protein
MEGVGHTVDGIHQLRWRPLSVETNEAPVRSSTFRELVASARYHRWRACNDGRAPGCNLVDRIDARTHVKIMTAVEVTLLGATRVTACTPDVL